MRVGVMGIAKSHFRIGAAAHLVAHHERDHARHVGLPGENHEIRHQLEVFREDFRRADGGFHLRHFAVALLLRQLHAPLDIANGLQILVDLATIRSAELSAQPPDVGVDGIEDAAVLLSEGQTHLRIGAGFAEKTLEDGTWAVLHRERRGLVAPRDRIVIGAAIGRLAGAHHFRRFQPDLERGDLSLFAEFPRRDLVDGDSGAQVRTGGHLRVRSGQPGGASARMVAAHFEIKARGLL